MSIDNPNLINLDNLILATDSYKLNHYAMYPIGTETVYSYFESRKGAEHPFTLFFGLQYILKNFLSKPISWDDIDQAQTFVNANMGPGVFNYQGWAKIKIEYGGKLPLRIKAVPEGLVIPTGNVLMTVENTVPEFYWLTNAFESLLTHVWYPTTVATRSFAVKLDILHELERSGSSTAMLDFMLQDFGYRGASSHESAGIGGLAHLVNFKGTDTVPALPYGVKFYDADLSTLGFSVPATEHSIMTALGEDGEKKILQQLFNSYPDGVLSVVNDSYDWKRHVHWLCTDFKEEILKRDGVFVTRPDSGDFPPEIVVGICEQLWDHFGGTVNSQGNKVIDPHIRILWGDGIDPRGINEIMRYMIGHGFAVENMACFGMGGGLLQKLNRDTERFAFKSSAQKRDGVWYDVFKDPIDSSKASKKGRLRLGINSRGKYHTGNIDDITTDFDRDVLETVFENGEIKKSYTFDEVRANAAKSLSSLAA